MEKPTRLDYLDRAKGFLIILVVIGHIRQSGYPFNVIYTFHMPAFFAISGILLSVTRSYRKGFGRFFLRKLYAFGIPFLFIEALGVLTDVIRHGITLKPQGYLFNTLILDYNDPNLWFLVDLFLAEMIFVLLLLLVRKRWAVCVGVGLLFVGSFFVPSGNPYVATLAMTCKYLPYLPLGFYGKHLLEKRSAPVLCLAVLSVLASGFFLGPKFSGLQLGFPMLENLFTILVGLLGTYMTIQISTRPLPGVLDRALLAAGRSSILIYGTHHIIYSAVGVLLGVTDYASTPLWAGLVMLAAVALLEPPIIYIINRWLPFLAGKHYPKRTAGT